MEDGNPLWRLLIIIALIAVEAVMTSAKEALESVNDTSLEKKSKESLKWEKKYQRVRTLLSMEEWYIDTAQVVVGTINIAIGALYSTRLMTHSRQLMTLLHISEYSRLVNMIFLVLFTIVLLLSAILLGRVIPAKLTAINPEKIALNTAGFMLFFIALLKPFLYLMDGTARLLFRIMQINPKDLEDNVTEEEIISIVNEGFEQGVLEDNEVEMISNIIELDDKEVRDVMTNRRKVVSVSTELSIGEALRFMLGERYSRFPLYEGERDNVVGVLHFKDVAQHYIAGEDGAVTLKEIAREAYFVPDTQSVDTLFEDMQLKKIHMAIAVDEYGQMAGVVALEDILEEIVGNILDEYDEDERMILKQGTSRYVMRGMAPLDEVEDALGIDLKQEEYDFDTLNGFLITQLGRLPSDDEKPVVHYEGYRFHVLDAKNNMVRTVRVVKEQEPNKALSKPREGERGVL